MSIPSAAPKALQEAFLASLDSLPGVRVSRDLPGDEPCVPGNERSSRIGLLVGRKALTLVVEARKSVFPRDARSLLWQFKQDGAAPRGGASRAAVPVLLAETISQGAKDLLRAEGSGSPGTCAWRGTGRTGLSPSPSSNWGKATSYRFGKPGPCGSGK